MKLPYNQKNKKNENKLVAKQIINWIRNKDREIRKIIESSRNEKRGKPRWHIANPGNLSLKEYFRFVVVRIK
jgi:hypothetical protein